VERRRRKPKEATTNAYLGTRGTLATIPRLLTNQIPGILTAGTSSDTSEVYIVSGRCHISGCAPDR